MYNPYNWKIRKSNEVVEKQNKYECILIEAGNLYNHIALCELELKEAKNKVRDIEDELDVLKDKRESLAKKLESIFKE